MCDISVHLGLCADVMRGKLWLCDMYNWVQLHKEMLMTRSGWNVQERETQADLWWSSEDQFGNADLYRGYDCGLRYLVIRASWGLPVSVKLSSGSPLPLPSINHLPIHYTSHLCSPTLFRLFPLPTVSLLPCHPIVDPCPQFAAFPSPLSSFALLWTPSSVTQILTTLYCTACAHPWHIFTTIPSLLNRVAMSFLYDKTFASLSLSLTILV